MNRMFMAIIETMLAGAVAATAHVRDIKLLNVSYDSTRELSADNNVAQTLGKEG